MVDYNFDWLKNKIKPLLEIEDKLLSINPEVFYPCGEWSVVKLIALAYFVDIYTKIIPRVSTFDKIRYLELVAGSGLCKIRETGDFVAGSALIASEMCFNTFDEYILIEEDEISAMMLEERMNIVADNVRVVNDDCNNIVEEIVSDFKFNDHYLAFMDCEGLEVDWSTIECLLSTRNHSTNNG